MPWKQERELPEMKFIVAATFVWALTSSSAFAFYQQTILFDKWLFLSVEEVENVESDKKVEQNTTKKWRVIFTNPMS